MAVGVTDHSSEHIGRMAKASARRREIEKHQPRLAVRSAPVIARTQHRLREAMSASAIDQVFAQMSSKDADRLSGHRPRLLQLGNEIHEQILGIVYSLPTINGSSALVVTSTRIIELTEGGSIQVHSYAELSGIRVGPGRKKLFGGYDA